MKQHLYFQYEFNKLALGSATRTRGVVLVHPIGVGIGKWFYDRLLCSLRKQYDDSNDGETISSSQQSLLFLVPDLLGSGSGCRPLAAEDGSEFNKLPLLNISDWSDQLEIECSFSVSAMSCPN